jgi:hypothetical protein
MPDIIESPSRLQFTKLLIEPLRSLQTFQSEGPIVVVLDALDECGNADDRRLLLRALAEKSSNLPSVLRVVIASRPDHDIRNHLEPKRNVLSHKLNIDSDDTRNDIEAFFRHQLMIIAQNNFIPSSIDWPGRPRINALVQRAAGLFIWASTACKFIDAYDPEQRLRLLLQTDITSTAESALDQLYITALQSAGDWTDTIFSADFRAIVGSILVLRNPLSATALNDLLPLDGHRHPQHAISRLGCVLYNNAVIHILHPSFADFLTNRLRCESDVWFIDIASHNLRVTLHCLDRLDSFLRRNQCDLTLSPVPADIRLPEDISYACTFWIEHVCLVEEAASLLERLECFLFKHLLHWFEAMSILKRTSQTIAMLRRLREWQMVVRQPFI